MEHFKITDALGIPALYLMKSVSMVLIVSGKFVFIHCGGPIFSAQIRIKLLRQIV